MVHELVHTTWNWMVMQFELRLVPDLAGKAVLVGLLAVAIGGRGAAVPLRRGAGAPMDARHDEPAPRPSRVDTGHGKLQPIDGQREERTQVVSARAG